MEQGQLSEMQRDRAWEGKDLAERQAMTAHNLNMGGAENARAAGLRGNAPGLQREDDHSERKRREERFEQALRRSIEMTPEAQALHAALGNYASDLRDELANRQRRSEELRDKIGATEAVLVLIQSGELDRDNPHHQDLIDRAGLDPDQSDEELRDEAESNLYEDRQELSENDARITEIERQLPHLDEAERMLENNVDPDEVIRFLESKDIYIDVDNLDRDHVFDRVAVRNSELRQEVHQDDVADATPDESAPDMIESDQEIEAFMQALAINQQTMMLVGVALVEAMSGQIENLSDEAREQLAASEDTAFLFDEPEAAPQQEVSAQAQHDVSNLPGNNL